MHDRICSGEDIENGIDGEIGLIAAADQAQPRHSNSGTSQHSLGISVKQCCKSILGGANISAWDLQRQLARGLCRAV